jgi:hypothetical protein
MKPEIAIPLPGLRFPEPGWRERFAAYTASAERMGLALEARLDPGESALLPGANGGRIGHVHLMRQDEIEGDRFARDYVGTYAFRRGEPHEVVLAAEGGEEHRFTTLNAFLESMLVRAWADALHRKAEAERGDDLDESPWVSAARETELRIDPGMLRTRED